MSKGFKNIVISLLVINFAFVYYLYYNIPTLDQYQTPTSLIPELSDSNSDIPLTIAEKNKPFNDLKKSIYMIRPYGTESGAYGTGVLIEEGIVLTAWHVISNLFKDVPESEWKDVTFQVQKNGHNQVTPYDATLISHNELVDIAIIKVTDLECPCVPLYSGPVSYEETVYTVYQLNTVLSEIITQGKFVGKYDSMIYSTNPLYFGASGGGLLVKRNGDFHLMGTIISMPVGISSNGRWPLTYITISTPSEKAIQLLENYNNKLDNIE